MLSVCQTKEKQHSTIDSIKQDVASDFALQLHKVEEID